MSLTLNMVGGGSGGGEILPTDALLRVQAPAGSTVTITKGAVTKSDLGHENALDPSIYDYYFIIHQSQFDSVNPWTVTASLSSYYDVSDTVIIDSADEYDVTLQFKLFLYDLGDENISLTGGLSAYPYKISGAGSTTITPTVVKNASSIRITSGTAQNYQAFIFAPSNPVLFTSYSTMKIEVTENTVNAASAAPWLCSSPILQNEYDRGAFAQFTGTGTKSFDISSITGSYYPIIGFGGTNNYKLTFTKWWLE